MGGGGEVFCPLCGGRVRSIKIHFDDSNCYITTYFVTPVSEYFLLKVPSYRSIYVKLEYSVQKIQTVFI